MTGSSGETVAKQRSPVHQEAAVGGLEAIHPNARGAKHGHPGGIAAQMGPACATHGEDGGRAVKALPGFAGFQGHAEAFQTAEPGAEQRRSLHLFWKDAARRAHEGFDAKTIAPVDHRLRREGADGGLEKILGLAIAGEEGFQRLRMGEIEPSSSRQQKLAAQGHGIWSRMVTSTPPLASTFRRHKPCGPGADNRNLMLLHGAAAGTCSERRHRPG